MNWVQAHGAGPGRSHGLAGAHAVLQHLQRVQELVAEHVLAAAEIGLGGEHLDGVVRRAMRRRRPSRGPRWRARTDAARRARARSCRAKRRASPAAPCPARRAWRGRCAQILRRRLGELGLPLQSPCRAGPGRAASGPARRRAAPRRRSRARCPSPAPRATAPPGSGGMHRALARRPGRRRRGPATAARARRARRRAAAPARTGQSGRRRPQSQVGARHAAFPNCPHGRRRSRYRCPGALRSPSHPADWAILRHFGLCSPRSRPCPADRRSSHLKACETMASSLSCRAPSPAACGSCRWRR